MRSFCVTGDTSSSDENEVEANSRVVERTTNNFYAKSYLQLHEIRTDR